MDVCHAFLKKVRESGLVEPADRIVVGVSGGVDSAVLLDILSRLENEEAISIFIAHVNYGLRGKESDRDEKFVARLAKGYGCKFFVTRNPPLSPFRKSNTNLQNAARDCRYNFFAKVAKDIGANKVALAHHADDQAETLLLHLARGSGLSGLAGMAHRRELGEQVLLIRPLLNFSKAEVREYAKKRSLKYVEDSSNVSPKYYRNILRKEVIPILAKNNPNIVFHLCKTAAILRDENEVLDEMTTRAFACSCHPRARGDLLRTLDSSATADGYDKRQAHEIKFKRVLFIKHHIAIRRRMLRLAYARLTGGTADLLTDHIDKMMWIISSGNKEGSYNLPKGVKFNREGNEIILTCHKKPI